MKIDLVNEIKPLIDRTVDQQMERLQIAAAAGHDAGTRGARRMGQDVPFDLARRGRPRSPRPVARDAPCARLCGAAARHRGLGDPDSRHAGREPHRAERDRAHLPLPGQTLDIVPPMDQGRVSIALPIDIPFTELNRILAAQIKGMTFPDDPNAAIHVTVNEFERQRLGRPAADLAAGARRRTPKLVRPRRRRRVHVWGRPVLDQQDADAEPCRYRDGGGIGGRLRAARRGGPGGAARSLQPALAENAVVDLKPLAENARKSIQAAIGDSPTAAPA